MKPVPGETRTAVSAFQLWEQAVEEGADTRLLSWMFKEFSDAFEEDDELRCICTINYDPAEVDGARDPALPDLPLSEEQLEACYEDKAETLRTDFIPWLFQPVIDAKRDLELELFEDTIMFIIKYDKTRYLKQFADEFSRLTSEGFNEIPVKVVTAFQLNSEQEELVQEELEKYAEANGGAIPVPEFSVNPSILGGIYINWNDKFDYERTVGPWFSETMSDTMRKRFDHDGEGYDDEDDEEEEVAPPQQKATVP